MTVYKVSLPENFIGSSTDTKPAKAAPGSRFLAFDTMYEYVFTGSPLNQWKLIRIMTSTS